MINCLEEVHTETMDTGRQYLHMVGEMEVTSIVQIHGKLEKTERIKVQL